MQEGSAMEEVSTTISLSSSSSSSSSSVSLSFFMSLLYLSFFSQGLTTFIFASTFIFLLSPSLSVFLSYCPLIIVWRYLLRASPEFFFSVLWRFPKQFSDVFVIPGFRNASKIAKMRRRAKNEAKASFLRDNLVRLNRLNLC